MPAGAEARVLGQAEEHLRLFERYTGAHSDVRECVEALSRDIRDRVREVSELARPFDPSHVLTVVRIMELAHDPNTFRESTHMGTVAAVELVAMIAAAASGATQDRPAAELPLLEAAQRITDIVHDIFSLEAVRNEVSVLHDSGPLGLVASNARGREIHLRNPTYDHIVEESVEGLFGTPDIEQVCIDAIGFTARDALAVFYAVERKCDAAYEWFLAGQAALAERIESAADGGTKSSRRGAERFEVGDSNLFPHMAYAELIDEVANHAVFDAGDVSEDTGLQRSTVEAVLNLFVFDAVSTDAVSVAGQFFESQSPMRMRPILSIGNGRAMLPHGVRGVHCIREAIENALKDSPAWGSYSDRRARYLEEQSVVLIDRMLSGATVHRNLKYFVPREGTDESSAEPARYTALGEVDGLLLVDDFAIIVEAKSGSLRPDARSGDERRLRQDLERLITEPARQATRLRQRIQADRGLRLRDDQWLDLSHVREIHLVAVTLEDTSGIVTATHDLITHGLLTEDAIPWTVSLHDLRVISEIVQRPSEFMLYVRRRTEPEVTKFNYSLDEVDLFMEFLSTGLYVEPDPDRRAAELPQLAEADETARQRYAQQVPQFLFSRTDDLDAWYLHQYGRRQVHAEKPALPIEPGVTQIIDHLASHKTTGWLSIGVTLLSYSTDQQEQFTAMIADLRRKTLNDGRNHTFTGVGGDRQAHSHVLVFASAASIPLSPDDMEHLTAYLMLKKHQLQVAIGSVIAFSPDGEPEPIAGTYDSSPPGPDPELDALVEESGLRRLEQMQLTNSLGYDTTRRSRPRNPRSKNGRKKRR